MQKIKIFRIRSGAGKGNFRLFQPFREIRRCKRQNGVPFFCSRIKRFEGNVGESRLPEIESGGIVVGSLIGPAAFAVAGLFILIGHVCRGGKVQKKVAGADFQISHI